MAPQVSLLPKIDVGNSSAASIHPDEKEFFVIVTGGSTISVLLVQKETGKGHRLHQASLSLRYVM